MATAKKSAAAKSKGTKAAAKPRKGVVPPALRAHMFTKKSGGKKK